MNPSRPPRRRPSLSRSASGPHKAPRGWYRPLVRPVYVPTILAEIGVGAMYPILALSPLRMGASATVASAVVVAYLVGRTIGSPWGGRLAAQRGAARTSTFGLAGMALFAGACAASSTLVPFVAAVILFGVAHSVFHVARQSQTAALVPHAARARGLTTLAGMWRIANFIGPVLGAVVIGAHGLRWAYVLATAFIALAVAASLATEGFREGKHHVRSEQTSVRRVARENRRILSTLGVAIALTAAVRTARLVALPLWAEHLGMADETASAIFALSAAVDMLLFYPAGSASDRWGRRWSAVPSTALLALGFIAIPFTTDATGLAVAAMVIGIGNGWGSGLVMTLGADVAPASQRSVFIGLWMFLTDLGSLAGPGLISLGAIVALPVGIIGAGVVGLGATAMLQAWIPPERERDRQG